MFDSHPTTDMPNLIAISHLMKIWLYKKKRVKMKMQITMYSGLHASFCFPKPNDIFYVVLKWFWSAP